MKVNRAIFGLITVFVLGCETERDKLFWVDKPSGQENDLLFLVESTNIESLQGDSLELFLTRSEFESIGGPPTTYKNFARIHEDDKFTAFVLLQEIDTVGRNYHFFVRTYDNTSKLIDSFELATWDEDRKKFCYGSISKDLRIERTCDGNQTNDMMQITTDGKIVMTSFQKQ